MYENLETCENILRFLKSMRVNQRTDKIWSSVGIQWKIWKCIHIRGLIRCNIDLTGGHMHKSMCYPIVIISSPDYFLLAVDYCAKRKKSYFSPLTKKGQLVIMNSPPAVSVCPSVCLDHCQVWKFLVKKSFFSHSFCLKVVD